MGLREQQAAQIVRERAFTISLGEPSWIAEERRENLSHQQRMFRFDRAANNVLNWIFVGGAAIAAVWDAVRGIFHR